MGARPSLAAYADKIRQYVLFPTSVGPHTNTCEPQIRSFFLHQTNYCFLTSTQKCSETCLRDTTNGEAKVGLCNMWKEKTEDISGRIIVELNLHYRPPESWSSYPKMPVVSCIVINFTDQLYIVKPVFCDPFVGWKLCQDTQIPYSP